MNTRYATIKMSPFTANVLSQFLACDAPLHIGARPESIDFVKQVAQEADLQGWKDLDAWTDWENIHEFKFDLGTIKTVFSSFNESLDKNHPSFDVVFPFTAVLALSLVDCDPEGSLLDLGSEEKVALVRQTALSMIENAVESQHYVGKACEMMRTQEGGEVFMLSPGLQDYLIHAPACSDMTSSRIEKLLEDLGRVIESPEGEDDYRIEFGEGEDDYTSGEFGEIEPF